MEEIFVSFLFGFFLAAMVSFSDSLTLRTLSLWFSRERKKIPQKWKELFIGRSRCTYCFWEIKPLYLLPVLGFLLAQGKCQNCQRPIPLRHFFLELLFFGYGVFAILFKVPPIALLLFALSLPALAIIWVVDTKFLLIPDYPLFVLLILAITYFFLRGDVFTKEKAFLLHKRAFLDLALSSFWFLLFHLIRIISKKKLGFRDASLIFALSLFLGFPKSLFLPTLAALLGIFSYLLNNPKKPKIPFAPYLILSMFLLFIVPDFLLLRFLGKFF